MCAPQGPARSVGVLEFSRLAMIHGIGVDIVQLSRIAHALDTYGERFLKRIYSPAEIQYCEADRASRDDPAPRDDRAPRDDPDERVLNYGARFAAKEAAFKAFRDDPASRDDSAGALSWHDFEVECDASGAPRLALSGRAAEVCERLGITRIHLSLSNTRVSASAIVVAEK